MNEAKEPESMPAGVTDAIVIDPNDFAQADEDDESVEDTTQPTEQEVDKPVETKTEEMDYTPFLNKIGETAKYNKEPVKLEKFDDVINNIEKGLNYDNLKSKYEALENSEEMTYIREQAKLAGVKDTKEFIKLAKDYAQQQQAEADNQQRDELIEKGISEELANSIIENNRIAREWQKEKAQRDAEAKLKADKDKKDAEDKLFLDTFPDVDVNTIPKEVFKKGEEIGLIAAYALYKTDLQKKELDVLKTNKENEAKAPVKGTTEHGGVVEEDSFLKAFNSR